MEFVAERFRRKVVALVYAGSNPVKLPRWSVHLTDQDYRFQSVHTSSILVPTTSNFNSTVVMQLPCNEQVAGSNPA